VSEVDPDRPIAHRTRQGLVDAIRKLIAQQWVTVDNIAAEEDGGLSFVSGEPFSETTNPAFKASVMGLIDSVDTMILGANTYADIVDEVRMLVCSASRGKGTRISRIGKT
jgi:hypothetical protein